MMMRMLMVMMLLIMLMMLMMICYVMLFFQEISGTDNRNSLVNFVMAIHNTSQRAKQVLTNFRQRKKDISSLSTTQEEPNESPQDSRAPSIDEGKSGDSSDEKESEETEEEVFDVMSRDIPEEPR
jgi:biopolymer transport protein ExbB/TolQ